ncbi:hypothetical protein CL632_02455 [bacterium]|nr:hypothetical protein [bacterium]
MYIGTEKGLKIVQIPVAKSINTDAEQETKQVLGTGVSPYYVNPFSVVDAKDVKFPVAQLRGCRNWDECNNYCDAEANYQACSSWSRSLE